MVRLKPVCDPPAATGAALRIRFRRPAVTLLPATGDPRRNAARLAGRLRRRPIPP